MKFKVDKDKHSQAVITVTLEDKDLKGYREFAAKELAKTLDIKGFRKGHVPLDVVEENYGPEILIEFALEKKLSSIYQAALIENKVEAISQPDFKEVSKDPYVFEFTVAIKPEIDLKPLAKVKIKKIATKVTKKMVEEEINRQLNSAASFTKVDRESKKGDRIEIDFEGFDKDNNPIPNTKSAAHPLVLGDGMFIPGFEENCEKLKAGDKHEFQVTFPKDYHAKDLANAKVTFKITVNSVEEKSIPKLDEATIEKLSYKKQSKADYEKQVESRLLEKLESDNKKQEEEQLYDEFLKKLKFEISPLVVTDEMQILKQELGQNLQKQGLTMEQYEKMISEKQGKSVDETYQKQAEERARLKLIIDAIVKEKKLEVKDADVDSRLKQEVDKAPKEIKDHIEKYYRENPQAIAVLKNSILLDKLVAEYIS